jgi:hypothetical protein
MRAAGYSVVAGIACLVLGCRTMPPELEPPKQPERLSPPPSETRYDTSTYPKEAFNNRDLFRRRDLEPDQKILPTRMGPGMNPGRPY